MTRPIPLLYWKAHELLKKQGLDDETLASKYRINKKDAAEIRREIEFWFGEKPRFKTDKKNKDGRGKPT